MRPGQKPLAVTGIGIICPRVARNSASDMISAMTMQVKIEPMRLIRNGGRFSGMTAA